MPEYITNNIEISSDSDRQDSNEEISNEENYDKENFNEENLVSNVFSIYIGSISGDFGLFIKYSYNINNLHKSYGKVHFNAY